MLLYDFLPVEAPFTVAAAWITSLEAGLLAAAANESFGLSAADGSLEHGAARARGDALLVGVQWAGRPAGGWFSRFEGDLAVAPLASRSHLSISASYDPWDSRLLPTSPEWNRHRREAEASTRSFLSALARSLT